ncbi:MAG TPA: hypothetical protein VHB79_31000 [Polyangiaceae bacterium]|nr:hypothetical protein [Polyangiaceae bacterium]
MHEEQRFSLDGWLNEELYGFVERNDRVDETKSIIVFDAVRARDVNRFLDVEVSSETLASLPGVIAVAEIFDKERGHDDPEMPEGSWQQLVLGRGTPADVYPELDAPPTPTELTYAALPKAKSKTLAEKFSISHLYPKATDHDLQSLLPVGVDQVAVYNVGQGNCSALCGGSEAPFLYFDTGGGCLQNTRTYPAPLRFCTSRGPGVVLSHWDFDHWFSALKVPELAELEWLVPDQGGVGKRTLAFAQSLKNAKFWPDIPSYSWSGGTIVRCTGTTRNDSGLAMFVSMPAGSILLPADATFDWIQVPPGTGALLGLVATHHGAGHVGSPIPRPTPNAKLAYSFGYGNSFAHPVPTAVALYESEGWQRANTRNSPNGHIWLGDTSKPLGCGRRNCDLATVQ